MKTPVLKGGNPRLSGIFPFLVVTANPRNSGVCEGREILPLFGCRHHPCQGIHDLIPDASPPPANEAIVASGMGTVVRATPDILR